MASLVALRCGVDFLQVRFLGQAMPCAFTKSRAPIVISDAPPPEKITPLLSTPTPCDAPVTSFRWSASTSQPASQPATLTLGCDYRIASPAPRSLYPVIAPQVRIHSAIYPAYLPHTLLCPPRIPILGHSTNNGQAAEKRRTFHVRKKTTRRSVTPTFFFWFFGPCMLPASCAAE
jgi:hypothetical protein